MNYYQARQLEKDGQLTGWHYTCMNDGQVWPIGYCSRFLEAKTMNEGGFYTQEGADKHNAKKDKFHGPSVLHATAAEACDCYVDYMLDNLRHFMTKDKTNESDTQHKCQHPGCKSFDTGYASSGSRIWILCDEHNTRDIIATEFLKKGSEFSSFGSM
jgi:hypothetical protein